MYMTIQLSLFVILYDYNHHYVGRKNETMVQSLSVTSLHEAIYYIVITQVVDHVTIYCDNFGYNEAYYHCPLYVMTKEFTM